MNEIPKYWQIICELVETNEILSRQPFVKKEVKESAIRRAKELRQINMRPDGSYFINKPLIVDQSQTKDGK